LGLLPSATLNAETLIIPGAAGLFKQRSPSKILWGPPKGEGDPLKPPHPNCAHKGWVLRRNRIQNGQKNLSNCLSIRLEN
jgi:hypothetical protein